MKNNLIGDIAPVQGETPYLMSTGLDSVIDFNDLVAFGRMWLWSQTSPLGQSSFRNSFAQATIGQEGAHLTQIKEKSVNSGGRYALAFDVPKRSFVASIRMEFDTSAVTIDSIEAKALDGIQVLKFFSNQAGYVAIDIAGVNSPIDSLFKIPNAIVCSITPKVSGKKPQINILAEAYSKDGVQTVSERTSDKIDFAPLIPGTYALSQNYPNPFNGSTHIKYQLPEFTKVSIVLYDILGRKVKTLVNEVQNAGFYEIVWEGGTSYGAAASGVYFLRMKTEKFVETKKLLLLR